ncbi:hypothetical protein [Psychroserpens mesophilus]|uniref:hypothetical protein n=1 Tax=Psychroserpens mesophilus TaxID=325473 RepID=UPI003D65B7C0
MNRKKALLGTIQSLPQTNIYINVNHLEKGSYKLSIVYNSKIIKSTHFTKEK